MPIPDYETLMLPLLQLAGDGREHTNAEAVSMLADMFQLTTTERAQRYPKSGALVFYDRINWARTFLKHAGLLENTGRARFRITPAGNELLKTKPTRIDTRFLKKYPQFREFYSRRNRSSYVISDEKENETPEDLIEKNYLILRNSLAQELLERIAQCSPAFFERLVVELLVAMGYGGSRQDAGKAVGQTGDEGIDGIIKEDKLGLDTVYLQAKRWSGVVGRPTVQQFAGSLMGRKARKGVLISTSEFSQDAKDYAAQIDPKIVLIGGQELAQLMIDHGIGVREHGVYRVYRVDEDYFTEE